MDDSTGHELVDFTDEVPPADAWADDVASFVLPSGDEFESLSRDRAADGTRTKLAAVPQAVAVEPSREWLQKISDAAAGAPAKPIAAVAAVAPRKPSPTLPPPIPRRPRATLPPPRRVTPANGAPPLVVVEAVAFEPELELELELVPEAEPIAAIAPVLPPLPAPPPPPPLVEPTEQISFDLADRVDAIDLTTAPTRAFEPVVLDSKRYAKIAGAAVVGIAAIAIGYVALRGHGASAPAASLEPTTSAFAPRIVERAIAATPPAPAPAAPVVAAPEAPELEFVAVPVTSKPAGATVTLVADGKREAIGKTPVTLSLDPSRSYDVVVALDHHVTRAAHVAPNTEALAFELDPVVAKHTAAPAAPAPKRVATAAPAAPAAPRNGGVLAISTKPPCEIIVDGKSTHLTTPQASLLLTPGHHAITLVNAAQKLRKTVDVDITAHKTTKVVQDYMRK